LEESAIRKIAYAAMRENADMDSDIREV